MARIKQPSKDSRYRVKTVGFEARGAVSSKTLSKQKKKQKDRPTPRQKSKQATVEDAFDSSSEGEDELQSGVIQIRRGPRSKINHATEVLNIIEAAAAALAAIGGREEVEAFLQNNSIKEGKVIESIRKHFTTIVSLLSESKSFSHLSVEDVPSTITLYDQSFVYRASSSLLYLLKPVEVFKGNVNYNRKKVFGFIRPKGSREPAMCAMPGWTVCTEKHSKLLEPDLWTTVVKEFVNFHNHDFRVSPFDKHHGREEGDTYAAHVEPRLMLWYAIDVLQKQTGKVEHPSKQRGDLWMLRDAVQKSIQAEIVISRPPCRQCIMFQDFMERYTPIKFSFIVCRNLGEVKFTKDKNKQVSLPLFVEESEDSEAESESELAPQMLEQSSSTKKSGKLAVVIKHKSSACPVSSASVASPPVARVSRQTTPSEVSVSTTMTTNNNSGSRMSTTRTRITVSQATHLQQFYYSTPRAEEPKKRRERNYFGDSDDEEWTPPSRSGSRSGFENKLTPTNKVTRNDFLTPAFSPDALERAKNVKDGRERPREMNDLQSPSKRSRQIKHSDRFVG
jgi:hypothetical protein